MERITTWIESVVLAIPRWLYRRIVAEEAARARRADEVRAELIQLRDAVGAAVIVRKGGSALGRWWQEAVDAGSRAAVLAASFSDDQIVERGRAFFVTH